jgi:molecular chaperone GrpE
VLDDIDRLAAIDPATTTGAALHEGFALIGKKLAKELEAGGLEAIDPVGEKFDPAEQEAVALRTPDDPALDDTVSATFQKGYRFRGNVIRHAKVQVYSVDGAL